MRTRSIAPKSAAPASNVGTVMRTVSGLVTGGRTPDPFTSIAALSCATSATQPVRASVDDAWKAVVCNVTSPLASLELNDRASSARFPKFVIQGGTFAHELRKAKGTSKSLILVPLFD